MTCGPVATTFRILDHDASWSFDLRHDASITLAETIELAQLDPLAIDPDAFAGVLPPPWIARGCEPCTWYLACPPHTVLRYGPRVVVDEPPPADRCAPAAASDPSCLGWTSIAGTGCHVELVEPIAVAAIRGHVGVLDTGRRELLILTPSGERVIATIPTRARGPIAFAGTEILVADGDELAAYDLITLARRVLPIASGAIARLAVAGGVVWAAIVAGDGVLELFRLADGGWEPGKRDALQAAARDTGVVAVNATTVCLAIPRGGATPRIACIDRCGRPAPAPADEPGPLRAITGEVVTTAPIDSGIPRCRWHRVRIELELPERTSAAIRLATVEDPDDDVADADWQRVDMAAVMARGASICDFLIDQPPGRYLRLAIALHGDGHATPRIRRVRLDFPRSTNAARLPGTYRDDPIAADFLERLVGTFDASIEDLDRVIERFPALLDPAAAPAEALAWLGSFLDIALDPAWSADTRREILGAAPELYRLRGTPWALARAIQLVTTRWPAVVELGAGASFARVARAGDDRGFRLGGSRLFGRARARMRLGVSPLGAAPLRSHGDPDRDHVAELGWRIAVQVPAGARVTLAALRRVVDAQKPAHVSAAVRVGGELALLGIASAVGIDTRLGGLPLPYLGTNTRLHRRTVLARGARHAGIAVGITSAITGQTGLS